VAEAPAQAVLVDCVLFGAQGLLHAHSHLQIQETCNGTFYSNSQRAPF
jgi:hypothetical protein